MPNPLFWLPFPVDRWLGELAGALRPDQKGALMDLLATAWTQQPPCTLPNDEVYLASRSGLGPSWKRLAPGILAHFEQTANNRLVCPWLRDIYEAQFKRYHQRKERNDRFRRARETARETHAETPPETSHETSHTPSHPASQNGRKRHRETRRETPSETPGETPSETSPPLARRTRTRTRRSIESSYELSNAPAPEARASALPARAAPGADALEEPAAPDTPSEDPGSEPHRNGRGGPPESISDVVQQLRPPGAVLRPSVAKEREQALAWANDHPDEATAIEVRLRDEWPRVKDQQLRSMLISAFVRAMNGAAEPVPEHAEVTP